MHKQMDIEQLRFNILHCVINVCDKYHFPCLQKGLTHTFRACSTQVLINEADGEIC